MNDELVSTGSYFNAIDPVNTRVVIVEVGGKNTANIQANIADYDSSVGTEYDTIYCIILNGKTKPNGQVMNRLRTAALRCS